MKLKTTQPIHSKTPTLFVTGDLDCRTSVAQVESIMLGFENANHVIVRNAGHEQSLWNARVFDELIPQFLKGEKWRTKPFLPKPLNLYRLRDLLTGILL